MKLEGELYAHPRTDQEHCHNLAVLAAEHDLKLEDEYRKRHPEITHDKFIELLNLNAFWDEFYPRVRVQIGVSNYRRILDEFARRALNGDLQAARFVLAELRLSQEHRAAMAALSGQTQLEDYFSRMSDVLSRSLDKGKKPRIIEGSAKVIPG